MKKEIFLPTETKLIKRRPRIYYASGMISLLLIPFFSCHFIYKRLNPKQRCLEIVMCTKDTTCNLCFRCIPPKRIYKQIHFTGNSLMERKTLATIDSIANTLFMNGDTINGLEVKFSYQSTYETMIRILDIGKRRHMPIYWPNGDQFWICFDEDYLKTDDDSFKTKLIARNKDLLETKIHDYEIPVSPEPDFAATDAILVMDSDNESDHKTTERNKNFYDFVYQRKVLIGLFLLVYSLMIVFTVRKLKRL